MGEKVPWEKDRKPPVRITIVALLVMRCTLVSLVQLHEESGRSARLRRVLPDISCIAIGGAMGHKIAGFIELSNGQESGPDFGKPAAGWAQADAPTTYAFEIGGVHAARNRYVD
jgi:hypothetical protein